MNQAELDTLIQRLVPDPDAARMVCVVSRMVRHADNCADRENEPPTLSMSCAMNCALVELPSNPFYAAHISSLGPLLSTIFVVWDASEVFRFSPVQQRRAWAFAWRDLIDVVLFHTVNLVAGHNAAVFAVNEFVTLTIDGAAETFTAWEAEGFYTKGTEA